MEPIEAEMAERFFKKEVQKRYLGAGQEFRGEGVLAVMPAVPGSWLLKTGWATELNLLPGGSL